MIREKGSTIMRTNGALYRGHVINPLDKAFKNIRACESVVISKNFNKGGSRHNHAHSLGVAHLQPRPYFQR